MERVKREFQNVYILGLVADTFVARQLGENYAGLSYELFNLVAFQKYADRVGFGIELKYDISGQIFTSPTTNAIDSTRDRVGCSWAAADGEYMARRELMR